MRTPRSWLMLITLIRTCGLAGGVAACDVEVPDQAETTAPKGADDAAEWIAGQWAAQLGMTTDYQIPRITFYKGKCLTWTLLPEPHDCTSGMYFSGEAWTGERIEMVVAGSGTIEETSIAHEFLHWALQHTKGDCDDGHHGPEWGDPLTKVEIDLCTYEGVGCTVDGNGA